MPDQPAFVLYEENGVGLMSGSAHKRSDPLFRSLQEVLEAGFCARLSPEPRQFIMDTDFGVYEVVVFDYQYSGSGMDEPAVRAEFSSRSGMLVFDIYLSK